MSLHTLSILAIGASTKPQVPDHSRGSFEVGPRGWTSAGCRESSHFPYVHAALYADGTWSLIEQGHRDFDRRHSVLAATD